MMKNYFFIICALIFSTQVFSQAVEGTDVTSEESLSTTNDDGSSSVEEPSQQVQDDSKTQENGNKQSDYQVFKPSEEISEDLTVPFPTDI